MGKEKALKGVDTSNFDWCGLHPDFGSPLHAVLFGKIRDEAGTESSDESTTNGDGFGDLIGDDISEKQARLMLLRLAMDKGADPDAIAPSSCDVQKFWFLEKRGQRKETKSIVFAGKSAFQCLLAAERAIKMTDAADWKEDLEAIDEAIEILSRSNTLWSSIPVSEGVIETWESVLGDTESADVSISVEAPENVEAAQKVFAHSAVLRASSPVLKAMLSTTGMREGARKIIEVKDCSVQALRLLLSLVYTGTTSASNEEPRAFTMLVALDLAHRWQMLHVVHVLAAALQRHLDLECFEPVMDAALRFQLPSLLSACRAFASSNVCELRARMGTQGPVTLLQSPNVRTEVARILGCVSVPESDPRKRQRRVL